MAAQSLLAKLGMRTGIIGSSVALAIAAPLADGNYNPSCLTDAARIGWYFDRTAGAEKLGSVIGGVSNEIYTYVVDSSGPSVNLTLNNPAPSITIGDGTGTANITFNRTTTGNSARIEVLSGSVIRAEFLLTTDESGVNDGGSNTFYRMYDDAGALINSALTFARAALGVITFNRPTTVASGTLTGSQGVIAASGTWNNAATTFTGMFMGATNTASAAGSLIAKFRIGAAVKWSIGIDGIITSNSTDDLTGAQHTLSRFTTITGNVTDSLANIACSATINGAFTVTRYNYWNLNDITGAATITDACVYYFNAAAGTHKAVDSGTTKTSPGTVSAWDKYNINGTLYYSPCYTSKTT